MKKVKRQSLIKNESYLEAKLPKMENYVALNSGN